MKRTRGALIGLSASVLMAVSSLTLAGEAHAAALTQVTDFGDNPGNMRMHVYVPDEVEAEPAIVVAMHGCTGSGPGFSTESEFASLADQYGYVVIYPSATQSAGGFGPCFDTWSAEAKKRDGGSDPVSIISMIKYVEKQYNGDPARVFATGFSSGAIMTQQMLALYPDVFTAGASFIGVPFGCFLDAEDFAPGASKCTGGQMDKTPQQWGDMVRALNPDLTGTRPRIQLWHGTSDSVLPYSILQESIDQWTDVFGLSLTPTSTDTIGSGWKRQLFADATGATPVEAITVPGADHNLPHPGQAIVALRFFGIAS